MTLWRLCRDRHADEPLSGRGGLLTPGRWHSRGRRIVYGSDSLALATLEKLVHVGLDVLPDDLVAIAIELPENVAVETVEGRSLPPDWRAYPAPGALRAIGDRWLDGGKTVALRVPSAIVPVEWNVLLNPEHDELRRVRAAAPLEFTLDPRLMGRGT